MSTASTQPKPSLDSGQLEWLKQMGAVLDVKLTGAASKVPDAVKATADSGGSPAKAGEAPPAAPATDNISVEGKPILKQGSKGQDVKDCQTLLNKHGATLKVDGDFGKLTTAAVKEFQTKNPPLKVDGIVGKQTWAALAASKPEPPKPPDTKPRRAVFIVTDAATNDGVKDAVVKMGEFTEKTGNTGQATISIPPGSYPFGVAADGFEQAIGTFEVTAEEESQKRVELKGGERRTKTVLSVSPSGKSNKGDKVELTATVTMGNGKVHPTGTVRFDVVLNGTGRRTLKDLVPLKDGKAVHTDTLMPKGSHQLDATFKPEGTGGVGSQSELVAHQVELGKKAEYEEARKAATAKLDDCLVSARSYPNLADRRTKLEEKQKEMEAKAKAEDFDEAKKLALELDALATAYLTDCAKEQKQFDKMGSDINKELDNANFFTRDDVARDWANKLKNNVVKLQPPKPPITAVSFLPSKVRNLLLEELQGGIISDDDKAAMKKLYSETYLDPEFEKLDKEKRSKMIELLKNDPGFKKGRDDWLKDSMTTEQRLEVLQKAVDYQAQAYGIPKTKVVAYSKDDPNDLGFYDHDDGKLYINVHDKALKGRGFDEAIDTAVHENGHRLQATMIDDLESGKIKPGDPLYEQAMTFKLNDTQRGFYVQPPRGSTHSPDRGREYFTQPQENHSRITGDAVQKAEIGK